MTDLRETAVRPSHSSSGTQVSRVLFSWSCSGSHRRTSRHFWEEPSMKKTLTVGLKKQLSNEDPSSVPSAHAAFVIPAPGRSNATQL